MLLLFVVVDFVGGELVMIVMSLSVGCELWQAAVVVCEQLVVCVLSADCELW